MSKYVNEQKEHRIKMVITNIIRVLLILIIVRGFLIGDHSQDFIALITLLMTYYPSILEKRFGVYLPCRLQIIITLFIFAAQYLGEIKGFYDLIPWWDTILHSTSGVILGIIGLMFVYLLNKKEGSKVNLSPIMVVWFAFCFAITIGVFWEFFEYGMDRIFGLNMQKFRLPGQDGLVDTMGDLFVDTLGALVTSIFGWLYIKKKNDVIFSEYFSSWFRKNKKENATKKS